MIELAERLHAAFYRGTPPVPWWQLSEHMRDAWRDVARVCDDKIAEARADGYAEARDEFEWPDAD